LRLYSWKPDTLSLGYFQRWEQVPAAQGLEGRKPGAIVRRISGGGAIHHQHELTFSISCSLAHPLYAGPLSESYERVHALIARALEEFGVRADLRGAQTLQSDRSGTGMCFHHSTAQDLVWNQKKGVGSAQRRRQGRVLHHGSIKVGSTPFEGEIAFVREQAPSASVDTCALALRRHFEQGLKLKLVSSVPDIVERDRARILGARYLSDEFVRSR
jgi:lipoate-protein ligase A